MAPGAARDPLADGYAASLLKSMVDIPSRSYAEAELASHLLNELRSLGFRAHLDAVGNVVGELVSGDGPDIMLLGHLDTVPGRCPVRLADGRLWGRGTVDAKGPLAAMICAAARVADFTGRIMVVGAVEEETPGSRGAAYVRDHYRPPSAVVIGEPSGWSTVVLGYKGKLDLRYHVECPATHPSNPAPKAAELAANAWLELLRILGPDASHLRFDQPGATLGALTGDLERASADMTVRLPPGFDVAGLLATLRERAGSGSFTVLNEVPACRVSRATPVAASLLSAIAQQGVTPSAKVKTATSDMNTLAITWPVPMAAYGPGDSHLDHSEDEHIVLEEYFHSIEVLTRCLTALADPAGPLSMPRPVPSALDLAHE